MHTGMLWFDNSQISFASKVQKGVEYYQKKYGRTPDLVLAHPSMFTDQPARRINEIDLGNGKTINARAYRPVLPGHIWIGIEDKE